MEANTATQVNAVIDHIADKLAVPSAELMELLPLLGIRDVIIGSLALVAWLVIAVAIVVLMRNAVRKHEEEVVFGLSIMGVIPLLFVAPFVLSKAGDLVLWFYSPEAWAVRYVFKELF